MTLNDTLVAYGIQNEETDYRAHVCVVPKLVYLYPTASGVQAIQSGKYRAAPAFQQDANGNSIQTAMGYLVPPSDIPNCISYNLPSSLWDVHPIKEAMSTSQKGAMAARIVAMAVRRGAITLPLNATLVTDEAMQLAGVDLLVHTKLRIQVKCDYRGGDKVRGGTGNLYLQIAEANPFGRY